MSYELWRHEIRFGVMQRRELQEPCSTFPLRGLFKREGFIDGLEVYCYVDESYVFRLERRQPPRYVILRP